MDAEAINDLLPQTQCTRCGYDGCRPYAQAIAAGRADINRCPPGGQAGIERLAALLGRRPMPLDGSCGAEQRLRLAFVEESRCIGCAICLDACPVDAIVGAKKQTHTVVQSWCTGCELCIVPCPVDCIVLRDAAEPEWTPDRARGARLRFESRSERTRLEREDHDRLLERAAALATPAAP